MRLTVNELRRIIKEEVESVMEIDEPDEPVGASIIPADEAAKIKRWSDDGIEIMAQAGASEEAMRAPRLVSDLAASVVALHAEVERLRALLKGTP